MLQRYKLKVHKDSGLSICSFKVLRPEKKLHDSKHFKISKRKINEMVMDKEYFRSTFKVYFNYKIP